MTIVIGSQKRITKTKLLTTSISRTRNIIIIKTL